MLTELVHFPQDLTILWLFLSRPPPPHLAQGCGQSLLANAGEGPQRGKNL